MDVKYVQRCTSSLKFGSINKNREIIRKTVQKIVAILDGIVDSYKK